MYVVVIDAVLGFYIRNKLKLRANNLRILLEYPLTVLYLIKSYFKLIQTRYKPLSLLLTY